MAASKNLNGTISQTVDTALHALEVLAELPSPPTVSEFAEALQVNSAKAYRTLRTLEQRRFVIRDGSGRISLGPKLLRLAQGVSPSLHTAAMPALRELAYKLKMTAFITVLDGERVVTLAAIEPTDVTATIAREAGASHHISHGAPGHAIESTLTPHELASYTGATKLSDAAKSVRESGYSVTRSEVLDGVNALAVPLRLHNQVPAAVAVVHFNFPSDLSPIVDAVNAAAAQIKRQF
ncbi:IclR family transcriptional regulator [Leucobacter sp. OH1287]|uniref:IclR family transcriptional regulator n=1 Tax=Leucobacter sp. OH1287 TaxID=2491049 RepID=UPI000F5F3C19|nr:helix-turn-helix domain-containing protein [Leucobacter sp. OH1287]RRD59845.1 IclR family transcriptional regulator [Leucobacter sp. OH1287]